MNACIINVWGYTEILPNIFLWQLFRLLDVKGMKINWLTPCLVSLRNH